MAARSALESELRRIFASRQEKTSVHFHFSSGTDGGTSGAGDGSGAVAAGR